MDARMRNVSAALAFLAACGCAGRNATELLVVVDTDLDVPSELSIVRFDVRSPTGQQQSATSNFAAGDARPAVLALVHDGGPLGPFEITVRGEDGGGQVVRQRVARVSFSPGRVLVLHLNLLRSCGGVVCDPTQSCGEGGCLPIDVGPSRLSPWHGGSSLGGVDGGASSPSCGDAGPCDDGVSCTIDSCANGACSHVPDSSLCSDDGIPCTTATCDPSAGCVQVPDDSVCDDGDYCTVDRCDVEAGCVHQQRGWCK